MQNMLGAFPNMVDGYDIYQKGQQAQGNRLAGLAFRSQGADRESALGKLAGIDAGAAYKLKTDFDEQDKVGLADASRYILAAPETVRPQVYASVVQRYGHKFRAQGIEPPQDYREAMPFFEQLAGGGESQAPADVRSYEYFAQGLPEAERLEARRRQLGIVDDWKFNIDNATGTAYRTKGDEIQTFQNGNWIPLGGGNQKPDAMTENLDNMGKFFAEAVATGQMTQDEANTQMEADVGVYGRKPFVAPPKASAANPFARPAEQPKEQFRDLTPAEVKQRRLPAGTVAQIGANNKVEIISRPEKGAGDEGRTLPANILTKIDKDVDKLNAVTDAIGGFVDDYAGNKFGGGAENMAGRLGVPGATKGQADWWQAYDRYKNQVRNELFGASLTSGEQAAFLAADIEPNMDPAVVRKNLTNQQSIIQKALGRKLGYYKKQGYGIGDYEEYINSQSPNAPVKVTSKQQYDSLPSGTQYIGSDGHIAVKK